MQSWEGSSFGRMQRNRNSVILLVIALVVVIGVIRAQADSGALMEPRAHRVVSIEIRGNDVVSDAEILEAMKVEVGRLSERNEAKKRVSAALGIGKLSNAVSKLEPTAGGRKLVVAVEEYPELRYRFSGNTVFSVRNYGDRISRSARSADTNVLNKDLAAILEEYEKETTLSDCLACLSRLMASSSSSSWNTG